MPNDAPNTTPGAESPPSDAPPPAAQETPPADAPAWSGWEGVRERPWFKSLDSSEQENVWGAFDALARKAQLAELLGEPEREQQIAEIPKLRAELTGLQTGLAEATRELDKYKAEAEALRTAHDDNLLAMADYRHRLHYPDIYAVLDANGKGAYADFVRQCDVEFSKLPENATSAQVQAAEERAAKMIRATLPQAKPSPAYGKKPVVEAGGGVRATGPRLSLRDKVALLRNQAEE